MTYLKSLEVLITDTEKIKLLATVLISVSDPAAKEKLLEVRRLAGLIVKEFDEIIKSTPEEKANTLL